MPVPVSVQETGTIILISYTTVLSAKTKSKTVAKSQNKKPSAKKNIKNSKVKATNAKNTKKNK